jgi:hypothetical protein
MFMLDASLSRFNCFLTSGMLQIHGWGSLPSMFGIGNTGVCLRLWRVLEPDKPMTRFIHGDSTFSLDCLDASPRFIYDAFSNAPPSSWCLLVRSWLHLQLPWLRQPHDSIDHGYTTHDILDHGNSTLHSATLIWTQRATTLFEQPRWLLLQPQHPWWTDWSSWLWDVSLSSYNFQLLLQSHHPCLFQCDYIWWNTKVLQMYDFFW